ncbi:hypothetical protein DL768_006639 [Monosporascus sp. mg162]|nr:hypothetical protein DL768_006639 [Monosporascus sp. mg162]
MTAAPTFGDDGPCSEIVMTPDEQLPDAKLALIEYGRKLFTAYRRIRRPERLGSDDVIWVVLLTERMGIITLEEGG